MSEQKTQITEDKTYKPSDPEMPERRFHIETEVYRWEVYVREFIIRETGTPVFYGKVANEHTAYGLTVNEVLNDLASILVRKSESRPGGVKAVSLDEVRHFLDPDDVAREEIKITEHRPDKSALGSLLLEGACDWAWNKGLSRFQLFAECANDPAIRFYEKRGWTHTGFLCLRQMNECEDND